MVYANSMDDRYLSQIANGWSKRCVCMYACYYNGSGGRAWIVVIDEGGGDFSIVATLWSKVVLQPLL
jgi:hypothetical protein